MLFFKWSICLNTKVAHLGPGKFQKDNWKGEGKGGEEKIKSFISLMTNYIQKLEENKSFCINYKSFSIVFRNAI